MIRSLASLVRSRDPFEREIAQCLLERFEQASDAEQWWREAVLIQANRPENEAFTFRPAERAALKYFQVECGVARELEKRGWKSQPDGTVLPGTAQTEQDK